MDRPKITIHGRRSGVPIATDVYVRYVCPACGIDGDVSETMLDHIYQEHVERIRGENKIA